MKKRFWGALLLLLLIPCLTGCNSIGEKATLYAAKIIAATGYELLTNTAKADEIIKEFKDAKVEYTPMYKD